MPNVIQHKRNSTSGTVPGTGSLAQGEIGINISDGKFYTKNSSNNIINLGVSSISGTLITPASGLFSGSVGIGTTSPAELLTVYGNNKYLYLQAQNNSGSAGIKFGNTAPRQQIYIEGTSNDLVVDSINGGITESIRIGYNTGAVTINESGSDLDFRVEGDTDQHLLFVDASADKVGIGISSPEYKLQVNGSFGATTKSFRIDHPSRPNYTLEYGSLESPYHGVRLTGRGVVIKGSGVVQLPTYLKDLIHDDENINIQITNIKHGKTVYVDEIDLNNSQFSVRVDRAKTISDLRFFWTLTGVRKDVDCLVVEKSV